MNTHHSVHVAGLLGLAEQVALERGISVGNLLKVPGSEQEEPAVIAARGYFWAQIKRARRDLTWPEIAKIVGRDVAEVIHAALAVRMGPVFEDPNNQDDPEDEVRP